MNTDKHTFITLLFETGGGYILTIAPFVVLVGILFWILRGQWLKKQGLQRGNFAEESLLLLFTCYFAGLLALVCTPPNFWSLFWFRIIHGYSGGEMTPLFSGGFNFVPSVFYYMKGQVTGGNWVKAMALGNVLLYVPFGFLLPAIRKNVKQVKTIAFGIALSVLIEFEQPIVGRSFDVDDIIANTIGTAIGCLCFTILKLIFKMFKNARIGQGDG